MEALKKLENTLDEVFEKKAPYQLPANSRKAIAGALWWLALVFGILQLWAAWSLWQLGHITDRYVDLSNSLSATYGTDVLTSHLGFFFYLSLTVLAGEAVLMLMAVSGLKAFKKRRGWDLLYYGLLINVAYGVVRALSEVGGGPGQLLWSLILSAVSAYFLFQVRSYFMGHNPAHGKVGVEKTTPKTAK